MTVPGYTSTQNLSWNMTIRGDGQNGPVPPPRGFKRLYFLFERLQSPRVALQPGTTGTPGTPDTPATPDTMAYIKVDVFRTSGSRQLFGGAISPSDLWLYPGIQKRLFPPVERWILGDLQCDGDRDNQIWRPIEMVEYDYIPNLELEPQSQPTQVQWGQDIAQLLRVNLSNIDPLPEQETFAAAAFGLCVDENLQRILQIPSFRKEMTWQWLQAGADWQIQLMPGEACVLSQAQPWQPSQLPYVGNGDQYEGYNGGYDNSAGMNGHVEERNGYGVNGGGYGHHGQDHGYYD
ncbi:hypothetical protein QBC35DRAFT_477326 [Podospora australis]|uniref:Uncharacterized protein n=1 Tax=Podospora australis TaxID=1536484 RepID=A0AAN6WQ69_9PEZI|nr:hypothetical protein QBC35DRAFT_477326 [Podospora australis]